MAQMAGNAQGDLALLLEDVRIRQTGSDQPARQIDRLLLADQVLDNMF